MGEVVAHRAPPRHPLRPLGAAVRERHRCRDVEMRPELGGQRGGHLDADPARLVDADGFVATGLARFAIGAFPWAAHSLSLATCRSKSAR
jgi:hypothetical protein